MADDVYGKGTSYPETGLIVDGLDPMTEYSVYAVACNDVGVYGRMQSVTFRTEYSDPHPYDWENSRSGILSYTDMVHLRWQYIPRTL